MGVVPDLPDVEARGPVSGAHRGGEVERFGHEEPSLLVVEADDSPLRVGPDGDLLPAGVGIDRDVGLAGLRHVHVVGDAGEGAGDLQLVDGVDDLHTVRVIEGVPEEPHGC